MNNAGQNLVERSVEVEASILDSVNNQLTRAKAEVIRLEELKKLLIENPNTQRILELIGKRCY